MVLIIACSPETTENAQGIIRPFYIEDVTELTAFGKRQAGGLGNILAQLKITEIITASENTSVTASTILCSICEDKTGKRPVHVLDERLHEINFKGLTGKTAEEIAEEWAKYALKYSPDNVSKYLYLKTHDIRYMHGVPRAGLVALGLESLTDLHDRLEPSVLSMKAKAVGHHIVSIGGPLVNAYLVEMIRHGTLGENIALRRSEKGHFPQGYCEATIVEVDSEYCVKNMRINVPYEHLGRLLRGK